MRVSSPTLYGLPETVRIIPTVVFDRKSLQPACTEKMFCTRRARWHRHGLRPDRQDWTYMSKFHPA